jgi:hypothetical protein
LGRESSPLGVVRRKPFNVVRRLIKAQKIRPTKMYEGFVTDGTVPTHLWCSFTIKPCIHFLGFDFKGAWPTRVDNLPKLD